MRSNIVNKYLRNTILGFNFVLTGFIPLSYEHDAATDSRAYIKQS